MSWDESGITARAVHDHAMHIAIDGPAGAGKSTVGMSLAQTLSCPYIDTGLMYRAVTLAAIDRHVPLEDLGTLADLARSMSFEVDPEGCGLLIEGSSPDARLRSPEVDRAVSVVASIPEVRGPMVARQRAIAAGRCVVMVGRDIGTVVLPDATVKLWITATKEERARRRLAEHLPGSEDLTDEMMVQRISERDAIDSGRQVAPLRRPENAIELDTGRLAPHEALAIALDAVAAATQPARMTAP